MISVRVEYFAQFRETRGANTETVSTTAATMAELYDELAARHGFQLSIATLRVAANARFTEWSAPPQEGDVIAFIAPVAGG